jgi:hypothetical protein
MWNKYFRDYIVFFILAILVIVTGVASYYRFMIKHDYVVIYEGECDSSMEQCFIGCNDDACIEKYYYSKMQKYAPDLYAECGEDITDCEAASVCLQGDKKCSITYCDPIIDGDDTCSVVEESLKDNDIDKNI